MPFMAVTVPYTVAQNLKHVAAVVGSLNAAGFLASAVFSTHKITDLVGVGSFVAATASLSLRNHALFSRNLKTFTNHATATSLVQNLKDVATGVLEFRGVNIGNIRLALANGVVLVWGVRLATFLFGRVLALGEDKRLNKFYREEGEGFLDPKRSLFPLKLAGFWSIQAAWAFLCLLPITYLNSLSVMGGAFTFPRYHGDFWVRDAVALLSRLPAVTAVMGVAVEAAADWQKSAFRADPANKDRWCDVGLYKYLRYPNYAGELLTWWSLWGLCAPSLSWTKMSIALVSPAVVTFLLTQVSGIPLLEEANDKKYAGNAAYAAYKAATPMLVPRLWPRAAGATAPAAAGGAGAAAGAAGSRVTRSQAKKDT